MTEALMINRNITRSTINEAMVNASLRSSEICPRAGTIEMDVLLCDYVRLRKVRTDEKVKKTKIDKKLKKWRKGWVVISTKELLRCKVEYYKDEECWLTPSKSSKKITISEVLMDIVTVEHVHSSYMSHVMSIVFSDYRLLIRFKSKTTMESWITKLNNIREYFLVQLITSSNEAIPPATYLIHVQAKKMVGYNAIGSQEVAWTWNSTDFCGYRLERKTIPEAEIVIGTQSAAHGNFRFIGPGLVMMCHSIKEKVLSLNNDNKGIKSVKKDGWLEDTWSADTTDGEPKACEDQSCRLQVNPSYGVLPSIPEDETKAEATKATAVYVNDTKQNSGVVYANDPQHSRAIVEEYEYIDVSPTPPEHFQPPKQQTLTDTLSANYEMSANYENHMIA